MRYSLLLLFIAATLAAADPFATPEVAKATEALKIAQDAYIQANLDAWHKSGIKPEPVPVLPADPKASEIAKVRAVTRANQGISNIELDLTKLLTMRPDDGHYRERMLMVDEKINGARYSLAQVDKDKK